METLTPEAIAKLPLRRNDVLQHVVFGVVNYVSKVRGNPNVVKISKTDRFTMTRQIVKCELLMKERNTQESGTMKKETPQDSGDDDFLTEACEL